MENGINDNSYVLCFLPEILNETNFHSSLHEISFRIKLLTNMIVYLDSQADFVRANITHLSDTEIMLDIDGIFAYVEYKTIYDEDDVMYYCRDYLAKLIKFETFFIDIQDCFYVGDLKKIETITIEYSREEVNTVASLLKLLQVHILDSGLSPRFEQHNLKLSSHKIHKKVDCLLDFVNNLN
ncbi:hypothetical protein [Carp edema virus]|nr:hypothetical protein [Carp edema virus]